MSNEMLKPFKADKQEKRKPSIKLKSKEAQEKERLRFAGLSSLDFFKVYTLVQGLMIIALLIQLVNLRKAVTSQGVYIAQLRDSLDQASSKLAALDTQNVRMSLLNKQVSGASRKISSIQSTLASVSSTLGTRSGFSIQSSKSPQNQMIDEGDEGRADTEK